MVARLAAIDREELTELVLDAWRMVVPKGLAALTDDELLALEVGSDDPRPPAVHDEEEQSDGT